MALFDRFVVAVVMSGEVACWSVCVFLLGMLLFSIVWVEFRMN